MEPVEVTVTCPSAESAHTLMRAAVAARLVACAQTWPITSCYRWDGEVAEDPEHLIVFKTAAARFDALSQLIVDTHDYDLPAIVMVPVAGSGPGYDDWLADALGQDGTPA